MPRGIPNRKVQTSGPAPKKTREPLLPVDKAALLERFKDYPAIDVITRRFNDPNDPGSLPILLKDEASDCCVNSDHQYKLKPNATVCHLCKRPARKWYVRYINTQWEGRWAQIKSKGYVPVEIADLKDEQDVADLVKTKEASGSIYVRRGDRGGEILCKIPLELFNYIKRSQRIALAQRANSKKHQQEDLAEAAGAELGDEAGQDIYDGEIKIESMTRSKSTLGDEVSAED